MWNDLFQDLSSTGHACFAFKECLSIVKKGVNDVGSRYKIGDRIETKIYFHINSAKT